MLFRLIYRSQSADGRNGLDDVPAILESARKNNPHTGLTGVLLADRSGFVQILEGRSSHLDTAFETILRDRRHHKISIIEYVPIDRRVFAAWAMADVPPSKIGDGSLVKWITDASVGEASLGGAELVERLSELLVPERQTQRKTASA